jgi:hypothetical protein
MALFSKYLPSGKSIQHSFVDEGGFHANSVDGHACYSVYPSSGIASQRGVLSLAGSLSDAGGQVFAS